MREGEFSSQDGDGGGSDGNLVLDNWFVRGLPEGLFVGYYLFLGGFPEIILLFSSMDIRKRLIGVISVVSVKLGLGMFLSIPLVGFWKIFWLIPHYYLVGLFLFSFIFEDWIRKTIFDSFLP